MRDGVVCDARVRGCVVREATHLVYVLQHTDHRPKFCISPSSIGDSRNLDDGMSSPPPAPWSNTGSHRWQSAWWGPCFNTARTQASRRRRPGLFSLIINALSTCLNCHSLLATPDAVKGESQVDPPDLPASGRVHVDRPLGLALG